jgi:acetyl-CoA C-acetyltransferase
LSMKKDVVIAGACRTAIGKLGGVLAHVPAAQLGSAVIREAVHRAGIPGDKVDEVFLGCVLQAAQGQNIARQAAIGAGLSVDVPAQSLNMVCGSGLKSVNLGAALILAGEADIVVAGGTENMSAAPYALDQARSGYRMNDGVLIDTMVRDALWDAFNKYHMGITAENLAGKYAITRNMQDEFAVASQQKCEVARRAGLFSQEIVPVSVKLKKETILIDQDEMPRDGVTLEQLANLKPAFKADGTVTAANASGINDGAAAVVLMSAEKAKELGVQPLARWVAGSVSGVDPAIMGIAPAFSTRKVLTKTGLKMEAIDLIEANEAFAVQSLAVGRELDWDPYRVNVNGGAIALGHPVGASGCRILVTLIFEMQRRKVNLGLATLCVGGGMGVSTVVERIG